MARPYTKEESDVLKKQFLNLLRSNLIVQAACDELGIAKSTIYYWRGTDPHFSEEFISCDWETVSKAENTLERLMEQDNLGAAAFVLKHRGRRFGYRAMHDYKDKEIIEAKPSKTDEEIIAEYTNKIKNEVLSNIK